MSQSFHSLTVCAYSSCFYWIHLMLLQFLLNHSWSDSYEMLPKRKTKVWKSCKKESSLYTSNIQVTDCSYVEKFVTEYLHPFYFLNIFIQQMFSLCYQITTIIFLEAQKMTHHWCFKLYSRCLEIILAITQQIENEICKLQHHSCNAESSDCMQLLFYYLSLFSGRRLWTWKKVINTLWDIVLWYHWWIQEQCHSSECGMDNAAASSTTVGKRWENWTGYFLKRVH